MSDKQKLAKPVVVAAAVSFIISAFYGGILTRPLTFQSETNIQRPVPFHSEAVTDDVITSHVFTPATRPPSVKQYHQRQLGCVGLTPNVMNSYRRIAADTFSDKTADLTFLPNYKNPCWLEKNGNNQSEILRCLPYVYVAGFPKSGTTDLFIRLHSHPYVVTGARKELEWWSKSSMGVVQPRFGKEPLSFSRYLEFYEKSVAEIQSHSLGDYHPIITSDCSISTVWGAVTWPLIPGNEAVYEPQTLPVDLIKKFTPGAKFVFIARNPTDRLLSHYYFQWSPANLPKEPRKSPEDFHRRVVHGVAVYRQCFAERGLRECIYDHCLAHLDNYTMKGKIKVYEWNALIWTKLTLTAGLYHFYITEVLRSFNFDRLKVVRIEEYSTDLVSTLNDISQFLDVGDLPYTTASEISNYTLHKVRNKQKKPAAMLPETRVILDEFYRPFNEKLATLLEDERYLWKD